VSPAAPWSDWVRSAVAETVGAGTATTGPVQGQPPVGPGRPTASSSPPSTRFGLVDLTPVASDGRAVKVARTLDTYYSGINTKDFARATSVFDPAGVLDPNDPAQVARLAHDDATSTVSAIVVRRIEADPLGTTAVRAATTFRSRQAVGYGPRGRESEACTSWSVLYTLTVGSNDDYRILRGQGTSTPC
jgi:hypothetical protein